MIYDDRHIQNEDLNKVDILVIFVTKHNHMQEPWFTKICSFTYLS